MSSQQRLWNPLDACTSEQREYLAEYERLLLDWNTRVNLISRSTNPAVVFERHVLHSLALAEHSFPDGCAVSDFGTGGGLPGVPLAIRFPAVTFHLVDSTLKKLRAIDDMATQLGLSNVHVHHTRAEKWKGKAHYAVSRATAPLDVLWRWYERSRIPLDAPPVEGDWTPGLLCLKGGDLLDETAALTKRRPQLQVSSTPLQPLLGPGYFQEKVRLHVVDPGTRGRSELRSADSGQPIADSR
ncbi:MAG: 16S rRNA (guanine(527)-N(7))-methyltransferase RsmG [Bacteroidota bacterium]